MENKYDIKHIALSILITKSVFLHHNHSESKKHIHSLYLTSIQQYIYVDGVQYVHIQYCWEENPLRNEGGGNPKILKYSCGRIDWQE